jgi:hypothetical protein
MKGLYGQVEMPILCIIQLCFEFTLQSPNLASLMPSSGDHAKIHVLIFVVGALLNNNPHGLSFPRTLDIGSQTFVLLLPTGSAQAYSES